MKRSGFQPMRRLEPRQAKQIDYTPRPREAAKSIGLLPTGAFALAGPALVLQKTPNRKEQAIRDSARDEDCLIRLAGCPQRRDMTIWSHCRHARAGKGGAIKALDLAGAYGCTYCDAVYDGQIKRPEGMTLEQVEIAWFLAHVESLVKLRQKGLA